MYAEPLPATTNSAKVLAFPSPAAPLETDTVAIETGKLTVAGVDMRHIRQLNVYARVKGCSQAQILNEALESFLSCVALSNMEGYLDKEIIEKGEWEDFRAAGR